MADWNERYRRGEHATLEPNHLLVRVSESLTPGRALDIACGAGRHALFLARRGWLVTALDASSVGIEITKERARKLSVEIDARVTDLERNEFELEREAYDLIIVFYYLQRDLWRQIRAGLRASGTLIAAIHLSDGDPENETGNPDFLLQPGELLTEFSDWEIVHYHETQLTDEDAGEHHHRTAELVARKP
ncbi:MAG TPA: methyltransferase domain-containing protein [Pyrinomonadaceae bacterium]|nr:methyltransferase domain-containing protein [Pyrinomonadaceae bacterium]